MRISDWSADVCSSDLRHEATYSVGLDVSQRSTSICVLDPDGKTVEEGQAKTNPFEIGRYLQKRLEGPLKPGMDRILALLWAVQERGMVEKRLEAQVRVTCTVRRSAHISRRSFIPLSFGYTHHGKSHLTN